MNSHLGFASARKVDRSANSISGALDCGLLKLSIEHPGAGRGVGTGPTVRAGVEGEGERVTARKKLVGYLCFEVGYSKVTSAFVTNNPFLLISFLAACKSGGQLSGSFRRHVYGNSIARNGSSPKLQRVLTAGVYLSVGSLFSFARALVIESEFVVRAHTDYR